MQQFLQAEQPVALAGAEPATGMPVLCATTCRTSSTVISTVPTRPPRCRPPPLPPPRSRG
ncbi:hypothetical protein BJF78_10645 [Pseudonocardia sp. CNS-139]|nr:hypothetical protein BJF78_10645 [Pseudonocardia sp. CNS-139]